MTQTAEFNYWLLLSFAKIDKMMMMMPGSIWHIDFSLFSWLQLSGWVDI